MDRTCYQLACQEIMPKLEGTARMQANGFKKIDFWVTPERKEKTIEYCRQHGITQTQLFNRLLSDKLAEFEPTPSV